MKAKLITIILTSLLTCLATLAVVAQTSLLVQDRFADVPESHPHLSGIQWAVDAKLMEGYTDGTWKPDRPITRAQMASILFRYHNTLGGPVPSTTTITEPEQTTTTAITTTTTLDDRQPVRIPKPDVITPEPTRRRDRINLAVSDGFTPVYGHRQLGFYHISLDWFKDGNKWLMRLGNYPDSDRIIPVPVGDFIWFQADICNGNGIVNDRAECVLLTIDHIEGGFTRGRNSWRFNGRADDEPADTYPLNSVYSDWFPVSDMPDWAHQDNQLILRITACGDGSMGCKIYPSYMSVVNTDDRSYPGWVHK